MVGVIGAGTVAGSSATSGYRGAGEQHVGGHPVVCPERGTPPPTSDPDRDRRIRVQAQVRRLGLRLRVVGHQAAGAVHRALPRLREGLQARLDLRLLRRVPVDRDRVVRVLLGRHLARDDVARRQGVSPTQAGVPASRDSHGGDDHRRAHLPRQRRRRRRLRRVGAGHAAPRLAPRDPAARRAVRLHARPGPDPRHALRTVPRHGPGVGARRFSSSSTPRRSSTRSDSCLRSRATSCS